MLEHVVDVVLHFEGDRNSRFRMVRAMKNRFGPVDEVGCFDLSADGITAVTDPTGLFVEHHGRQVAGTCVAVTMEGRRPMLAEIQGLVTPTPAERPRRTTSGLDGSRVAMVLAVLQQHCGIRLHTHDVFASTVGGARVTEPASDLAVAVALASATRGVAGPDGSRGHGRDRPGRRAAPGARPAPAHRRGRAARLRRGRGPGRATRADGIAAVPRDVDGMRVIEVPDVASALRLLGVTRRAAEDFDEWDSGAEAV